MKVNAYLHKVQYYETDQMGIVHHSNYIRWFEEARVDFMEQTGLNYDLIERDGYLSPVTSVTSDFVSMTKFGSSVYILTKLESYNGIKFTLSYRIIDSMTKELKAKGKSSHCFINREGKLVSIKKESQKYHNLFTEALGIETEE